LPVFQQSFILPTGFFPENEETSAPPPYGFLIGIYLSYENWSQESKTGLPLSLAAKGLAPGGRLSQYKGKGYILPVGR